MFYPLYKPFLPYKIWLMKRVFFILLCLCFFQTGLNAKDIKFPLPENLPDSFSTQLDTLLKNQTVRQIVECTVPSQKNQKWLVVFSYMMDVPLMESKRLIIVKRFPNSQKIDYISDADGNTMNVRLNLSVFTVKNGKLNLIWQDNGKLGYSESDALPPPQIRGVVSLRNNRDKYLVIQQSRSDIIEVHDFYRQTPSGFVKDREMVSAHIK